MRPIAAVFGMANDYKQPLWPGLISIVKRIVSGKATTSRSVRQSAPSRLVVIAPQQSLVSDRTGQGVNMRIP